MVVGLSLSPSRNVLEDERPEDAAEMSPSRDPAAVVASAPSWLLSRLLFRGGSRRQGSMTPLKAGMRAEEEEEEEEDVVDLEVESNKKKQQQRRRRHENNDNHERPKFRRCKSLPVSAAEHDPSSARHQRSAAPRRRPSIPSSIHDDDFDDDSSSTVSEVTMVTYSAEKVESVRREFFRRMRLMADAVGRHGDAADFTTEEKEAVLRRVQAEQEEAWRMREIGAKLFARRIVTTKEERMRDDHYYYDDLDDGYWQRGTAAPEGDDDNIDESEVARGTIGPLDQSNNSSSPNLDRSDVTRQVTNGSRGDRGTVKDRRPPSVISERDGMAEEVKSASEYTPIEPPSHQASSLSSHHGSEAARSRCSGRRARIDDVIELKLLVANQRAAIDALSMRLRTLEGENKSLLAQEEKEARRVRGLEEENRRLGRELEALGRRRQQQSPRILGERNHHHHHRARHHLGVLDVSSRSEPPPTRNGRYGPAAATTSASFAINGTYNNNNNNNNALADFLVRLGSSSSIIETGHDGKQREELARENSDLRMQIDELRRAQRQQQRPGRDDDDAVDGKDGLGTRAIIGAPAMEEEEEAEEEVPVVIRVV